jgi:hypothetical protein
MRVTVKDLERAVKDLNKRYKKTDRSAIKFDLEGAYGGYQLVLRRNRKYGGGVMQVTYGFLPKRELMEKIRSLGYRDLNYKVKRFHEQTMASYKRKPKSL